MTIATKARWVVRVYRWNDARTHRLLEREVPYADFGAAVAALATYEPEPPLVFEVRALTGGNDMSW